MSAPRVLLPSTPPEGATSVKLGRDESGHLVRSLRARTGDAVTLLDGRGLIAEGTLADDDPAGATVKLTSRRHVPASRPAVTLAQGMPKGGTMDDLVRTACEAGAVAVIPLVTGRCEVRLDPERAAARRSRWRVQAAEACKQSGNAWIAEVAEPAEFSQWLAALGPAATDELRLTGSLEPDATPVGRIDFTSAARVTWLIGPEGDLTPDELAAARRAGFRPCSLGPTVLRAENAALACLAATFARASR
ncbi:MAG: RsmE family RNA methyltransferase [Opitutales bacterium]